jgi:hypothetical protein
MLIRLGQMQKHPREHAWTSDAHAAGAEIGQCQTWETGDGLAVSAWHPGDLGNGDALVGQAFGLFIG